MATESSIKALLDRAREFATQGKYLHAVQVYLRATAEAPDVEAGWIELAHVYLHLHQSVAAERALLRALDSSRQPAQILYFLGSLNRETGNRHEALRYFRRLLTFERTLSESLRAQLHFDLGLLYRDDKNWRVAEYHLRSAHRLDQRYPRVNEALAEVLLERGALTDASRFLQKALAVEPYSWSGHFLLGRLYARQGEWERAHDEFVMSVEADPEEARGWHMCGNALLALHRLDESERYLRKALELDPALADAMADLGLIALRRGDLEGAQEHFMHVLNMEPANRRAKHGQRELVRLRNAR
jgi:tetratricopeptide (TPR) repeat protein